jgi:hypothetical protein
LYASVQELPPNAKAAFCVPAPAKPDLPVIKAPPADQEVPLYASVQDTVAGVEPPNAKDAFCVPAPAKLNLAVIKAVLVAQEVPLYASAHDTIVGVRPPNAKAAVWVPAPAKPYLLTLIAPPADQALIGTQFKLSTATATSTKLPVDAACVFVKVRVVPAVLLTLPDVNESELTIGIDY